VARHSWGWGTAWLSCGVATVSGSARIKMPAMVLIHSGTIQNSTLHNGTLQNGLLHNSRRRNGMLQHGTALKNRTVTKQYKVIKRYMLQNVRYKTVQFQNGTLQNGLLHNSTRQKGMYTVPRYKIVQLLNIT
jgi:hypothetical protein